MADLRASGLGGVPKGQTADRPASPSIGDVFYNGTLGCLEIYTSQGWVASSAPPAVPTSIVATNQPTNRAYNNGQASVAFSNGAGGGFIDTFTVTPSPTTSPATFTGSSSPVIVTGLQSSQQYTYTVQARNNFGTSLSSAASTGVTATTVPQSPTISATGTTDGSGTATITITPGATGGSAITQYSIISNPATTTQTTSNTTYTFTGLTIGTSYTFTATATNANGTSVESVASNSITPLTVLTVDYLVVAGGGGGGAGSNGNLRSGGGGAGGLRSTVTATGRGGTLESPVQLNMGTNYTILVGAGGTGSATNGQSASVGNGINSSISGSGLTTITSIGGGGGGNGAQDNNSYLAGATGGSGGGGAGSSSTTQTTDNAAGTNGQGYDGGTGQHVPGAWASGGGGGGAGSQGGNGASNVGGSGGNGVAVSITGSSVTYAGGGAGGTHAGATGTPGTGTGSSNTGGGGNCGGSSGNPGNSGVVILRTTQAASSTTGSPTYTTSGIYHIYKFTANGSITY